MCVNREVENVVWSLRLNKRRIFCITVWIYIVYILLWDEHLYQSESHLSWKLQNLTRYVFGANVRLLTSVCFFSLDGICMFIIFNFWCVVYVEVCVQVMNLNVKWRVSYLDSYKYFSSLPHAPRRSGFFLHSMLPVMLLPPHQVLWLAT